MALMDKMKAAAATAAQKAQEAGKAGQSKLEDVKAGRKTDALLRELGAAVYAQKTGTATSETAGDIDRLVEELKAAEAEHAASDSSAASEADSASEAETPPEAPPEGGFKL
jgi:hypothetical protein